MGNDSWIGQARSAGGPDRHMLLRTVQRKESLGWKCSSHIWVLLSKLTPFSDNKQQNVLLQEGDWKSLHVNCTLLCVLLMWDFFVCMIRYEPFCPHNTHYINFACLVGSWRCLSARGHSAANSAGQILGISQLPFGDCQIKLNGQMNEAKIKCYNTIMGYHRGRGYNEL